MNIISLSTIVLLIIYCAYLKSKINRLLREDTPVADYTNNRQITAIQEEKISKKEQIAQKNDTTNYTSNTLNTLHLQTKEYGISSFKKATLIVGMRTPGTFDNYQDKGKKQFETECRNNSISIDNYVNICHLLPVLDMRNYHIELIKDGLETYSNEDNQYIGSHEWQKKWSKIIFSSKISSKEFCDCIRAIMAAHNFTERDNSIDNSITLDGKIKEKESFFIFRALHIMHYNIKIRTYSLEYEKLNVNISNNPYICHIQLRHRKNH